MITVTRQSVEILPSNQRVLLRPYHITNPIHRQAVMDRVFALSENQAEQETERLLADFGDRHHNPALFFEGRCEAVWEFLPPGSVPTRCRRLLIGACFTMEYALEAAALFNPSLVWHPDQSGVPDGGRRFVLSLRATGEGHVSSLVFRSGIVDRDGQIALDPDSAFVTNPQIVPDNRFEKPLFQGKLQELGLWGADTESLLAPLPDLFTLHALLARLKEARGQMPTPSAEHELVERGIVMLARSNYELTYAPEVDLSERVLFPYSPREAAGIEDARFVQFVEADGRSHYYATYTAYDGRLGLPQVLETPDFQHFKINTLNGAAVENKGFALFPRRINGHYAMLSRQDGENIYLMYSDSIHFWFEKQLLLRPKYTWEMMLIGNCGSPIETEKGWLVVHHGVGPMRHYVISAFLLDLDDPSKVIGRLAEPLLMPNHDERHGYVPNVLYSCGSQILGGRLILPYASSDSATHFATVPVAEILAAMQPE